MGRGTRIAIVLGGYVTALAAGAAAGWWYDWRMAQMPYDTSGGMYAGGEALTSLAAFLFVALFPTLLGLWWLRGSGTFWKLAAGGSIGFAGIGLLAVLAVKFAGDGAMTRNVAFALFSVFGLIQLLGAPFWFLAFVLFAFLAPTPDTRKAMKVAVAIEGVIGVVAFVHWFVPMMRF